MDVELDHTLAEIRRDRPLRVALYGPSSSVARVVTWVFVFASACHLWLADVWQLEWLPANLIYLAGVALLCWRGAALGWLLSALGLLIPLLFHRDQLTQSVILLVISSSAGLGLIADGLRASRPGSSPADPLETSQGTMAAGEWTFLGVAKGVTIVTYFLAVLHKINREYLDPDYSCAVYGTEELFNYWGLPIDALPASVLALTPWLVVAAESGIALLHMLGRRRLAWLLAVGFHIPLTLTMAPAFVFVMFVGHAAFMRPADLERLSGVFRRHWVAIGAAATLLTTVSLVAHKNLPEWTMIPREWLLWGLLMALLVPDHLGLDTRAGKAGHRLSRAPLAAKAAVAVAVGFFLLNGLTPYLGVQFQHAGAMVSNLRIDQGCWNSLVFPESVRLSDDYVRIEEVYYGEPGQTPKYEAIALDQLWSPPQIRQMRRNWCEPHLRPFYMRGTFRGREFVIDDVCDTDKPLPFSDDGIFGVEIFKDYLRFQKNLERECPQACIH
ncbi:MAG: hypothetical protein ACLFVJ_07590 [Persicimonas sp.]